MCLMLIDFGDYEIFLTTKISWITAYNVSCATKQKKYWQIWSLSQLVNIVTTVHVYLVIQGQIQDFAKEWGTQKEFGLHWLIIAAPPQKPAA